MLSEAVVDSTRVIYWQRRPSVCVCVCVYIRVCRCHGATLHDVFVTGVAPAVTGVRRGSAPLPPVACRRPPAPGRLPPAVPSAVPSAGASAVASAGRQVFDYRRSLARHGPVPVRCHSGSHHLSLSLSLSLLLQCQFESN